MKRIRKMTVTGTSTLVDGTPPKMASGEAKGPTSFWPGARVGTDLPDDDIAEPRAVPEAAARCGDAVTLADALTTAGVVVAVAGVLVGAAG